MSCFEWDSKKEAINIDKHGVSFEIAKRAFFDSKRLILADHSHSTSTEERFYCLGKIAGEILTVRFTYREPNQVIRIIGAGYWRKGKKIYEDAHA